MSEILYQANPSVWRMRPLGTLIAWLVVVFGLYVAITGNLPYLAQLTESLPVLKDIKIGDNIHIGPRTIATFTGYGLALIGAFNLLRSWLACLTDRLEIRRNEILWTHGLLAKNYTEINMGSIRTVRVNQSLLQRLLGAGDLVIFTTGDEPELAVRGLPRPNEIRDHIRQSAASPQD
ncbi:MULTISPECIES: PH domain-containing protein [Thiorhodovibrio]|uniref:PH domain-containing protein n=1 Tax=Thiorhodovibrio TaxID=61593 RepID=UPI0019112E97|nr:MULTISPECIES: PH domain-containing protein [Thiorhodovibrio]MBK5970885.1 hypothetical protein [Thiorhodovibrio winogradskyi]WPL11383.1 Bacterial membrane flanked domain protein [Thiorhodovibrio litoralis]